MPRLPDNLDALRDGNFRRLLGAAAVSWFGDRMVTIALAFAVLEIGGSATAIGLVLAVRTGALLVSLLFGGVVADRVPRRAVMIGADLSRVVTQGLLAALVIAGAAEVWSIALLTGLTGIATGFFNPASTGLLPAIVPPEKLQQANGIRATLLSAGEIGGPVAAGVLVALVGAGWALAVDASTFAASGLLLLGVRVPGRVARAATGFWEDLREGWTTFSRTTWVWTFVLWASIMNLTFGAWGVLGPVVAERELGGAATWGAVNAALGIGALLGALAAIRRTPRRPILAAALTGFFSVPAMALLAGGAHAAPLAVGAMLAGIGMMYGNTVWESALQRHIDHDVLSRVTAYDWFGSMAFAPLGLAIWGPVAEATSIGDAIWVATALTLLSTVALLAVRDARRLQTA
ncbi:MAG TPA: MFS transporter [Solirubrobacteraceae bacterium]|nr:MFS transporter [Solirubrobacteraceae bacterium]